MSNCLDQYFPCANHEYSKFDKIAQMELRNAPSASQIVNESAFCTVLAIDTALQHDDITYKDFLKGLRGKNGLYHLWIDYDNCDEHDTHTMLGVYVGKGMAEGRILAHIKEKWPSEQLLYVGFYECSNRMAKYFEQLFLDNYKFYLNKNENHGTESLFAVWSHERHLLGTELHSVSNLSRIASLDDLN